MYLRFETDTRLSQWVNSRALLKRGDQTVADLLPKYARYARVLNPAHDTQTGERVTWRTLSIGPITSGTTWASCASQAFGLELTSPREGAMDPHVARRLVAHLSELDLARDSCTFLQWEGYADFPTAPADAVTVNLGVDDRLMVVLAGSLQDLANDSNADLETRTPVWWLANDDSWACGSDIYARSTYVGGPASLIDRILEDSSIEAVAVSAADRTVGEEY